MNCAKATTKEVLSMYFNELHRIMEKYDLLNKPNSIYNMDETNINAGHKPPKVANTRAKSKTNVISSQRIATTLIARSNAAGRALHRTMSLRANGVSHNSSMVLFQAQRCT